MSRIWPNGGSLSPASPGNGRPEQFQSTNEFGTPHDLTGTHRGIDLINFTNIHAVDDGKVVFSGHNGTAGYEIKIRHTDLTATRYLHMEFGSLKFITGDYVKKGDIIGKMGATGYVTGKHLHFECIDPNTITRINPRKYINPEVVLGDGSTPFEPQPTPQPQPEEDDMFEPADRDRLIEILNKLSGGTPGVSFDGDVFGMVRQTKDIASGISDGVNRISEELNPMNAGFFYETTQDGKPTTIYLLINTASGWYNEFSNGPGNGPMSAEYNNGLARAMKTGTWAKITASHARGLKASADLVRASA